MPTTLGAKFKEFTARWPALAKLGKGSSTVGLDVGSRAVKGVKVQKVSDRYALLQYSVAPASSSADPALRAQPIREVLRALGAEKDPVVTAVGGAGTVLRSVAIPKMSPEELKTALVFEAEKYIPFKMSEVFLDSAILGDQPGGRMEISLAAARKDVVRQHLELLQGAGVLPRVLDLEPVALANAWEVGPPPVGEGPVCLLHLGARTTILNVFSGARLQFTREIPIAGDAFTQAVAEGLQTDSAGAEQLKRQPGERTQEVRTALQPAWDQWLGQCRASFDFFENQFGRKVDKIYLAGGSARLAGLKEWIQETMGVSVDLWNPTAALSTALPADPLQQVAVDLDVAVGLAVRGAG